MADSLGHIVSWYLCTATACIFLVARLWIRIRRFNGLGPEDGLIILAAACLIADLVIQQYMSNLGMADIKKTSRDNFIKMMQMIVPGSILYVSSLWAVKVAMVLFYKRLAAPKSTLQVIYNVALGLLVFFWGVITLHIFFQCYPHDRRWSKDPAYKCDAQNKIINYWLTVVLNIGTDIATISLPISMVLKLQMKLKQKLAVAAVFALGLFVVIASIVRAYYAKRKEIMLTCTVSMIETAVAIIASCLPPLRSLFLGSPASARVGGKYRRFELTSPVNSKNAQNISTSRVAASGSRDKSNSEEELIVSDKAHLDVKAGMNLQDGVTVTKTFQVHDGTASVASLHHS